MISRRFFPAALAGVLLATLALTARADDATVTTYNIRHFLGYGNADYGGHWGDAPWVLDGTYENRWYPDPNKSLFIDGRWMTFWEFFVNVLNEVNSDIIILQEVPTGPQGGTEIIAELALRLGMNHYTMPSVGGTQHHWLAILSRYPIVDVKNYSAERDIDYHGLIRARVRLAEGALLDVFSTHLDSASEFWRQDNLAKIIPAMQESPYPHVLGCDLNAPVNSVCYNMLVDAGYRESRRQGIDFIWLSPGNKISELQTATAVWQRWTGTGEPRGSDHAAIKTTIRVAPATPPLHVDGKYIKDPSGNIVILRGVAMIHTPDMDLWRPGHEWMIDQVSTEANGWYAKVIRIGVRVESYLANPNNIVNNHLIPAVNYCTSKGLYCIVDWHYIDDGRTRDAQTRQFWNHVAPIFKDYDNVLYEVFNEHTEPTPWAEWKATAQPWVDLIRSHAPNNLILVSGPHYSHHIQGAATNPFNGTNLAYVAHIYPGGYYPLTWDGNIGVVADVHPVVVTEWGYDPAGDEVTLGTRSNFGIPFQNWAESKGVSWIAWVSDYAWGPPMFNNDWTPNDFGSFAKDWLFNKRNSNQPEGGDPATFSSSATVSPASVSINQTATIQATITCETGSLNDGIVDLEIYNSAGTRVGQQFWTGQDFGTDDALTYSWDWSTATAGTYTVRIGVFTAGWADTLHWNANAATFTVTGAPAAPTGLTASAVSSCQVNMSWNASSGATSYNVKRSGTSGGPYTTIATGVTSTSYNDTGRALSTAYYYVVSAVNLAWESGNSTQASATTLAAPAAPSGLNATAASPSQINLTWTDNSTTEAGFKIERSTDGASYTQITTVGANVSSYSNTGLAENTTYHYRIRANDSCGNNSGYSNADSATTPSPDPTFSSSAVAAPRTVARSVATTITITVTCASGTLNDGIVDVEIYNSSGARVGQQFWTSQDFISGQSADYSWNWSSATAGTYTVKIGVFSAGWAEGFHWNNGAQTITVATTVVRRNSGGGAIGWFAADANFSGGTAGSTTAAIGTTGVVDPAPAAVYQTERYGPFSYTISGLTAGATHTVRLHFAEIYWTAVGQRKFHVKINGSQVLTDFDIVSAAGGARKAVVRQFTATANSSGQIIIQYLNGSANYPQSSGIEIIR